MITCVWLKVFLGNKALFKHGLTSRASPIHILFNISIPAPPPTPPSTLPELKSNNYHRNSYLAIKHKTLKNEQELVTYKKKS